MKWVLIIIALILMGGGGFLGFKGFNALKKLSAKAQPTPMSVRLQGIGGMIGFFVGFIILVIFFFLF